MIYLDNAATTWPKPRGTAAAIADVLSFRGANPGRGSYRMAELSSETVYRCRSHAAEFFGAKSAERVIFTPSCTASINYVLKGALSAGDHVIISDMEHNAVTRPVHQLSRRGVQFSMARVHECDPEATVAEFRRCMRVNTKLIFCTHASNVFGIKLPVAEIGELAHRNGILFGVDCAQSAGTAEIDLRRLKADFLCMPAHKGLYGIMGLGMLIINCDRKLRTLIEGGTGSLSGVNEQPDFLPDRFESGTLNVPAIAALDVGMSFIDTIGRQRLENHEMNLVRRAYDAFSAMPECALYTARPETDTHVPLLSFNIDSMTSDEAAQRLGSMDIAVRAGLHCAGDAHRKIGTQSCGTIRVCPSVFTSDAEMDSLIAAVKEIARKA